MRYSEKDADYRYAFIGGYRDINYFKNIFTYHFINAESHKADWLMILEQMSLFYLLSIQNRFTNGNS